MTKSDFKAKYGPWGLVAGGASGFGGAWSEGLAQRGINVAMIDRDPAQLEKMKAVLRGKYGVAVRALHLDLADETLLDNVRQQVDDLEIGMLIYNAGLATVGPLYDNSLEDELAKIYVNVRGPLMLSYHFGKKMTERKRGGIILLSSGAGLTGAPYYTVYSATKAFDINLAEGLWYEFQPYGVDAMAVIAGLTRTPGISSTLTEPKNAKLGVFMDASDVVDEAFAVLGTTPSMAPGKGNKRIRFLLSRLLPRKTAIRALGQHALDNFLDKRTDIPRERRR